jgi:hypothetical protein
VKFCFNANDECESHAILLKELPTVGDDVTSGAGNRRRLIVNADFETTNDDDDEP